MLDFAKRGHSLLTNEAEYRPLSRQSLLIQFHGSYFLFIVIMNRHGPVRAAAAIDRCHLRRRLQMMARHLISETGRSACRLFPH